MVFKSKKLLSFTGKRLTGLFTRILILFDIPKLKLKPSALKVFKDEYLIDFIAGDELDDERHIEQQVVLNIRNFILQMGKGFCFIGNQYRIEINGDEFLLTCFFSTGIYNFS